MSTGPLSSFTDFIKTIESVSDLERRRIVYHRPISYDIKRFYDFFYDTFVFNIRNIQHIDLWELKTEIYYMKLAYFINIKQFCELINSNFKYLGSDSFTRSYKTIKRLYKININVLSLDNIKTLKNNYIDLNYNTGLTKNELDNLILRYFITQEDASASTCFSENRKISYLDFNSECCVKLSLDSLINICKNEYCFDSHNDIKKEIIGRIQRMDKLYSIDIPRVLSEDEFDEFVVQNKDKIDKLYATDTITIIEKTMRFISKPEFDSFAKKILIDIKDDLDLIKCIFKINIDFLDGVLDDTMLHRYTRVMIDQFNITVPNEIIKLNTRQKCLLKQVCVGAIYIQTKLQGVMYSDRFITLLNKIITKIPDMCSRYIDPVLEVSCLHDTFSYYALSKWMNMFCGVFLIKTGIDCNYVNVMNASIDLLYPKRSFCDNCHDDYKALQQTQISITQRSDLNTKNQAFVLAEKLVFFRRRFADQCDTELYPTHFLQINNQEQKVKTLINEMVLSMRSEITRIGYIVDRLP